MALENIPDILYKYREINEFSMKIITEGEIYLPSVKQLNDPFEGSIPFMYDEKELTTENIFKKMYAITKSANPTWNEEKIHRFISSEYQKGLLFNEEHIQEQIKETNNQVEKDFGVFSLTTEKNNFLMWSHYAKSHNGFCIGFNKKILFDSVGGILGEVIYQNDLPTFGLFDEDISFFYKLLFTKSNVWEYENEYRLVKIGGARQTIAIPKDGICEIILGYSMEEKQKEELQKLIEEKLPKCKLFTTSLNNKKFKLDIIQIN